MASGHPHVIATIARADNRLLREHEPTHTTDSAKRPARKLATVLTSGIVALIGVFAFALALFQLFDLEPFLTSFRLIQAGIILAGALGIAAGEDLDEKVRLCALPRLAGVLCAPKGICARSPTYTGGSEVTSGS